MKKWIGVVVLIALSVACTGCGKKYECDICGKSTSEAYYDPFESDTYYCEDCAKEYFAPLPYTSYKVQ